MSTGPEVAAQHPELKSPVHLKFGGLRRKGGKEARSSISQGHNLEQGGRAAGMPAPGADRREGEFVGGLGGDRQSMCWRAAPECVSFWEKSLKGGPRGPLRGARQEEENPQGSGERQTPLPLKEGTEPNKSL